MLSLERPPDGRSHGGRLRIRGPLGLRRTAWTQVLAADPPQQLFGVAEIARRTRAFVRWKLSAREGATHVSLKATIDRAGAPDRLLLMSGGRRWLGRRFTAVLERLAARFSGDAIAVERRNANAPAAQHATP